MLAVGTKVCAKYKGAFCEAKIISVSKNLQNKVCQFIINNFNFDLFKLCYVFIYVKVQNNTDIKSKPCTVNSVKGQLKVINYYLCVT